MTFWITNELTICIKNSINKKYLNIRIDLIESLKIEPTKDILVLECIYSVINDEHAFFNVNKPDAPEHFRKKNVSCFC